EGTSLRLLLVEVLARVPGKESSVALAKRALFDLSVEVRQAAVKELAKRPKGEYLTRVVEGLRYPWPAAADHAAETLVALEAREAVPTLVKMLDQPDPLRPVPGTTPDEPTTVRELVRVNHLG